MSASSGILNMYRVLDLSLNHDHKDKNQKYGDWYGSQHKHLFAFRYFKKLTLHILVKGDGNHLAAGCSRERVLSNKHECARGEILTFD